MRHGLLPVLALFLQPWLFLFSNTAATGISGGGGGIILKPIKWRIMVSCRYNASMKPHPRASFRSLGYFLILFSFCGARERTREGKRRRARVLEISAFALKKRRLLPVSRVPSILPEEWFATEVALLFLDFISTKAQSDSANMIDRQRRRSASLRTKTHFRSSRLST